MIDPRTVHTCVFVKNEATRQPQLGIKTRIRLVGSNTFVCYSLKEQNIHVRVAEGRCSGCLGHAMELYKYIYNIPLLALKFVASLPFQSLCS